MNLSCKKQQIVISFFSNGVLSSTGVETIDGLATEIQLNEQPVSIGKNCGREESSKMVTDKSLDEIEFIGELRREGKVALYCTRKEMIFDDEKF